VRWTFQLVSAVSLQPSVVFRWLRSDLRLSETLIGRTMAKRAGAFGCGIDRTCLLLISDC
jgi:hypothetical protein